MFLFSLFHETGVTYKGIITQSEKPLYTPFANVFLLAFEGQRENDPFLSLVSFFFYFYSASRHIPLHISELEYLGWMRLFIYIKDYLFQWKNITSFWWWFHCTSRASQRMNSSPLSFINKWTFEEGKKKVIVLFGWRV